MGGLGRTLVFIGLGIAFLGVLLWAGERMGLGQLPGDLSFKGKNWKISVPLASSLLISVLLTLLLNLFGRR